jgi:hypothetical protein
MHPKATTFGREDVHEFHRHMLICQLVEGKHHNAECPTAAHHIALMVERSTRLTTVSNTVIPSSTEANELCVHAGMVCYGYTLKSQQKLVRS